MSEFGGLRKHELNLISRGREFKAEGAAYETERFPNVFVLTCGIRRVLESEEEEIFDVLHPANCEWSYQGETNCISTTSEKSDSQFNATRSTDED